MPGQYVELTFEEPVVIASLMSGGFIRWYVNNFTVQYSLSESGEDFQVYGALQATQVSVWGKGRLMDSHAETLHLLVNLA